MQDYFVLKDGTVVPKNKEKYGWQGLVFALLPFIGFVCFSLFPIALTAYISFTDMGSYSVKAVNWVGFANYVDVMNNTKFWHSIGIALYSTLGQFISLSIALGMSVLLSTKVKGWNIFSVLYFIPYIVSSVAVSIIWKKMFSTNTGIINEIIGNFGYTGEKIDWLKEPGLYMVIFLFIQAWHAPGYGIIMFNAAFTAIDETLYEAARIDGASRGRQFTAITLPSISPTIYFLVMLGLINGMQQFEMFQVFTGLSGSWVGAFGPDDMGLVPLLYIYQLKENHMAEAATMSWFLFFIVFAISKLDEKFSKVWVANEYE